MSRSPRPPAAATAASRPSRKRGSRSSALPRSPRIEALVLHFPTVKPLDEDAVVAAAQLTGAIVTAEDHSIIGGLGSAVAEVLGERLPTPLRRVGMRDVFGESGPNDALLEKYGMAPRHVAAAAREAMAARDHGPSPGNASAR